MKRGKKAEAPRYEIRSSIRAFHRYIDRAWAEHSAECYASFFNYYETHNTDLEGTDDE